MVRSKILLYVKPLLNYYSIIERAQKILRLALDEISLPKFYVMFGISKCKSAAVTAFRSSCRHPPDKWLGTEKVTQVINHSHCKLKIN